VIRTVNTRASVRDPREMVNTCAKRNTSGVTVIIAKPSRFLFGQNILGGKSAFTPAT
jgi:hypothetical protein